jgi:Restriction Endonuclease associating with ARP
MIDAVQRAKEALWDRYRKLNPNIKVDTKGYIGTPKNNLLQPEWMELIIKDYKEGEEKELEVKFCAVHSSAALVANHFARFKPPDRLPTLSLLGRNGAKNLRFERKLPIFRGGTPPNLDVWIDRDDEVIAIESMLTEYFAEKPAKFSKA